MTQPLAPPGGPHGAAHPPPAHGDPAQPPQSQPAAVPGAQAQPTPAYQPYPYAPAPHQPPAGASGPPSGTFALAVAGTILGSVAVLLALVSMFLPMLFVGGMWEEGEYTEDVTFEEASPTGSLTPPDSDGYTSAEVTTAVSEALDSFVFPITAQCPAISAAMARDLEGRTVICEGDDDGWTMTVFVVFSDADGGFVATPY